MESRVILHLLIILLLSQIACTYTPNPIHDTQQWGYDKLTTKGVLFQHTVFIKKGKGKSLHIYLEGDGRPWQTTTRIAADPTSKNPLMLRLMALDSNQSIYIGRPCYFEPKQPPCSSVWWTFRRYSEEVIDSMVAVVNKFSNDYDSIVLMGHSGGGTLAMLLAARLPKTTAIVTLAGNLDIEAWANHHQYSQLTDSLNPAEELPLPKSIQQFHYLGTADTNILATWIKPVIQRQYNATLYNIEKIDHNCCWEKQWRTILRQLSTRLTNVEK